MYLVLPGLSSAEETRWTVSEASPGVIITFNGVRKPATKGLILQAGSELATGPNARAIVTSGEKYVVIAPSSKIDFPAAQTENAMTELFEDFGNAVFSIKKGPTPHFAVRTHYLAAVVKGTTFSVTSDASGSSVQVVEGAVDVAPLQGMAHQLLVPGAVALVRGAQPTALSIFGPSGAAATSAEPPTHANTPPPPTEGKASVGADASAGTGTGTGVVISAVESPNESLLAVTGGLVSGQSGGSGAAPAAAAGPVAQGVSAPAGADSGQGSAASGGSGAVALAPTGGGAKGLSSPSGGSASSGPQGGFTLAPMTGYGPALVSASNPFSLGNIISSLISGGGAAGGSGTGKAVGLFAGLPTPVGNISGGLGSGNGNSGSKGSSGNGSGKGAGTVSGLTNPIANPLANLIAGLTGENGNASGGAGALPNPLSNVVIGLTGASGNSGSSSHGGIGSIGSGSGVGAVNNPIGNLLGALTGGSGNSGNGSGGGSSKSGGLAALLKKL